MSNINNTLSGERLSFFKLFAEKKYRVLIPIIQRDYAQGRKNTKEVRETFLDALYQYLKENKPNRDLDFVYGSLNEVAGITDFIPLDGQQRLTTLFLLHWYLYQISIDETLKDEFKNSIFVDGKSLFSYETRTSSSDFCNSLMNYDFNQEDIIDINENKEKLSTIIRNMAWYYLSWNYDPTIKSMLTMLDAIHEKFQERGDFFSRLLDVENPIITFLFLNLKDFKLTDDLYIKMNSRGKALTSFENFKAKFEQYLNSIEYDRDLSLNFGGIIKSVSLKEYFSFNIDTKWANLFWNYRAVQHKIITDSDDTFDDELMNFIRVIIANQYMMDVSITSKDKDDALGYLMGTAIARNEDEYSDFISFSKYEELKALNSNTVFYLVDAFDALNNGNKHIKVHLSENYKFYFDENKIFENALKNDFVSNQERICFHAYIRFLIYNKGEIKGIEQWMRVVHNLSHPDNTIIDSATGVAMAVKSVEELLPFSSDIISYLKTNPSISSFSTWQVLEEKIKAHLIFKNLKWKDKIETAEKHKYFNGQIAFILNFSGVIDYYKEHLNCDWSSIDDEKYFENFTCYMDKACLVFDESYDNRKYDESFVFERAVLSKGDYTTEASQNRYNLLSTNLVKNNIKRDHSWKRLLRYSEDSNWVEKQSYVKAVLDDNRFNTNDFVNSLESICKDKTNDWRDYFISCPSLFSYCRQGFIRFNNEFDILLYGESQSNHTHSEMYSYFMWINEIKPNIDSFAPFGKVGYYEVKTNDEEACVYFIDFCYNRINYEMNIFFYNEDDFPHPYEIKFHKSKGEQMQDKYGEQIRDLIEKAEFEWSNDYEGYFYSCETSNKTMKKIREVLSLLSQLV